MSIEKISSRELQQGTINRIGMRISGSSKKILVRDGLRTMARECKLDPKMKKLRATLEARNGKSRVNEGICAYVAHMAAMTIVEEEGIRIVFMPEPIKDSFPNIFAEGPVELETDLVLHPAFTLSSYEPVHIVEPPVQITEEMVQAQLAKELARLTTYEPTDGPVAEDDVVAVNMTTVCNGEPEPGLSGKGMRIILSKGMVPQGFIDNVTGMEKGEERSFAFAEMDAGNPSNVPDEYQVSVRLLDKRRRIVPELTDELVRTRLSASCGTVEEFKASIRDYLAQQKQQQNASRREELVETELATRLQGAVPDPLMERTRDQMTENIRNMAAQQGMNMMQFMQSQGMSESQFQMTVMMQARASLRQGFALDALYEHLQLPITDEHMRRALTELAPGQEDEARASFDLNNAWSIVRNMAGRLVAHDWLIQTAVIE